MSMIFEVEERIAAPKESVWRHLIEPGLMAAWMPGTEEVRTPDGGPLSAGSTFHFKARGKELQSFVAAYSPVKPIVG